VKTQPDGTLFLDVDKPILGLATINTDMGIVYSGRIEAFKGIRYRVQLNVRNLFNEWTLVPVAALTTGQHIRYNRLPPRTYIATTTFDF
jgi:outer membrane receptor protein involved in Fe transport